MALVCLGLLRKAKTFECFFVVLVGFQVEFSVYGIAGVVTTLAGGVT
jgi:hypothetical protein